MLHTFNDQLRALYLPHRGRQTAQLTYFETKEGGDQDEELGNLKEHRPVLDIVEDEPGGDHAEAGHQEGETDLHQCCAPPLIRAWSANIMKSVHAKY